MSTSTDHVAGQVFTAANADNLAQGVLGIQKGTSDVGPTSSTTELDVITAPAVTIASTGRRLRITGAISACVQSTTPEDSTFEFKIKESSTQLDAIRIRPQGVTDDADGFTLVAFVDNPSAASHTYKMTVQRISGTQNCTIKATSTRPIKIVVEDVGTT